MADRPRTPTSPQYAKTLQPDALPLMSYRNLVVALPCHGFEDFPTHYTGEDAQGLLAAWCLPWHPALVADAGRAPSWRYLHAWDDAFRESLIIVPEVSRSALTEDWQARAVAQQTKMLVGGTDLDAMTAEAVASVDDKLLSELDQALVADFQSLGYWYLQVQLLTRQMRYASHLDDQQFQQQLLQAALAAVGGDGERAREHLQRCFAVLAEERDHYYPVEAFVLDLVLTAPAACDDLLLRELQSASAQNVLMNGSTLEHLARTNPAALEELRGGLDAGRMVLVGGDYGELPLPLLPCETLLEELRTGQATFERLLGRRAEFYGRRRFGMTPFLPQVLRRLGYRGVLHATLDDGRFPESAQARTQWQGVDGTTIDTLCAIPMDAGQPETFLKLAVRMGESMETDYVATVCLAHWPGRASQWLDFLRRGAEYGLALGRFSTLERFFEHTSYTGHSEQYAADRYRAPYLRQSVAEGQENVISGHVQWWQTQVRAQSVRNLAAWYGLLSEHAPRPGAPDADARGSGGGDVQTTTPGDHRHLPLDDPTRQVGAAAASGTDWEAAERQVLRRLAVAMGARDQGAEGTLVMTPWSAACRTLCDAAEGVSANHPEGPIFAVTETLSRRQAVVDVPAGGFSWLPDSNPPAQAARRRFRKPKPLVEDTVLQNEFMEVHIDPATGGLRAVFDYQNRANRLSQQLVFCPPLEAATDRPQLRFSRMRARRIEPTQVDQACGELTATGELVDPDGQTLATFRQIFTLWRGSRVLRVAIEMDPRRLPGETPWKSYYASRVAWADEANILYRDLHGIRQAVTSRQFESPSYIAIDAATQMTYLINGGLTYHHRVGNRMLDTLLVVHHETARRFELGIGVDLRHPLPDCFTAMVPPPRVRTTMPSAVTGWLFHVDARHVVTTGWELLWDSDTGESVRGCHVRLLETEGRAASVTLRTLRPIQSARRVDFLGQSDGACKLVEDACQLELAPYEWTAVELRW